MKSLYELLFSVSFNHDYFSNGRFEKLRAYPLPATERELLNRGWLLKPAKQGFNVFFDTGFAGRKRSRQEVLKDNITLQFYLRLTDPAWYNYTGGAPEDILRSIFHFSNSSTHDTATPRPLQKEAYAGKADLVPVEKLPGLPSPKPFALLDMHINEQLEEKYVLRFRARSTFWKYILVSDHLRQLNNPAIVDTTDRQVFSGPENIMLPDERAAVAFASTSPIGFSEMPEHAYRLVENYEAETGKYKVVISSLPQADIHTISNAGKRTGNTDNTGFSEIFIY